jgi:hypothetical protein
MEIIHPKIKIDINADRKNIVSLQTKLFILYKFGLNLRIYAKDCTKGLYGYPRGFTR